MKLHARERWCGVALGGALLGACSKPGGGTEGPAAEAWAENGETASSATAASQVQPGEPGVVREGCPEGMVRIEGNETLKPFCMGETEVSVGEFRRCVEAGKCRPFMPDDFYYPEKATWLLGDESMPINYVSEEQAQQYCELVGGRLPTGDEWLWALGSARGWVYPWGNEHRNDTDRYCGCWLRRGQRPGSPALCSARQYPKDRTLQGVYDMVGSASEIVGPNEEGDYGIHLQMTPLGVSPSEVSDESFTHTNKAQAWYTGPLVTWQATTSFRCVATSGDD